MADLVVDASLASAWCFPGERTDYSNGILSRADAEEFLASLADLHINLVDPVSYVAVFRLAELHGLTVYDAAYPVRACESSRILAK